MSYNVKRLHVVNAGSFSTGISREQRRCTHFQFKAPFPPGKWRALAASPRELKFSVDLPQQPYLSRRIQVLHAQPWGNPAQGLIRECTVWKGELQAWWRQKWWSSGLFH